MGLRPHKHFFMRRRDALETTLDGGSRETLLVAVLDDKGPKPSFCRDGFSNRKAVSDVVKVPVRVYLLGNF
jgi:hypothetical protein